jgi:hypothetical protein
MAQFSRDELKTLAAVQVAPCVSIYIPINRAERPQNLTRIKSLLDQARGQLQNAGLGHHEIEQLLAPVHALNDDNTFLDGQSEGVAVFVSRAPDSLRWYTDQSSAIQFREQVIVADHFYLTPLLPLLTGDGQFYVLAVSQGHAGLMRGTRDTIRTVNVPELPESLREAIGEEQTEAQLQGRPMNKGGGEQTGTFGGYDPGDDAKERVTRFLHSVNKAVHNAIDAGSAPLVFAGLDYLHGIYKNVNSYPYLIEDAVTVNAETLDEKELHAAAWPLVEPIFEEQRTAARDRYGINKGDGKTSHVLADILAGAFYGRVDTLFLTDSEPMYGRFTADSGVLEVHKDARPDNSNLLDLAAVQTVLNGGTVYVGDQPLESGSPVAAIFRY